MAEVRNGLTELYPRLWRFSLTLTGDRPSADDLAQATVTRALENAEKFQAGTKLDRWLFTLARRIWLNEKRSEQVRKAGGLVAVEEVDIPSPDAGTETNIIAREVFSQVMKLPEAQRIVVLLVYVEGYRYREAAEMMDIPIGTVMSRLAAARKTIQASESSQKAGTP